MAHDLPHGLGTAADLKQTGRPGGIRPRLDAIDLVRGAVMVLMALDHTRDYLTNPRFDPLDLAQTNTGLFLTRWVTHFCAPVFVFLAGTGAFLYGSRRRTRRELAWFLVSRGLWLVLLEFTLIHLSWSFAPDFRLFLAQVIWAIGWSMVLLAGLVYLPTPAVAALGVLIVAGHNAFDGVRPDRLGAFGWLWEALCSGGPLPPGSQPRLLVAYPVLPWFGVMALGYGIGPVWLLDRARRRRWLLGLGTALTLLFVVLRAANGYGDPRPWSPQSTGWFTFLAFLNCRKYPPSLLYVLMTLGPALQALAWFDRETGPLGRVLVTYGRVPLFFYLLHAPLIHAVAVVLAAAQHVDTSFLFQHIVSAQPPAEYGYGLPVVYLVWLGVVAALHPACRWFAAVKRRHPGAWLSYL
jgi:uncharacterized membrane protein